MHLEQRFALGGAFAARLRLFELWNRNAEAFGELSHGVGEADLFLQLHELEDVPTNAAAETVKKAAIAVDVERRRFLTVKRTETFVAVAGFSQRDIVGDDGDDVSRDRKSTRLNSSHLVTSYAVLRTKRQTTRPAG